MNKRLIVLMCTGLVTTWAACWQAARLPQAAMATSSLESNTSIHAKRNAPEVHRVSAAKITTVNTPTTEPDTAHQPDIPAIVDKLYLGVPVGNGHRPYHVAVDGQSGRAYTLNYGIAPAGNTISVLDLETRQVTNLIHLDNMEAEDFSSPDPLALQVDPYRPRLYALWGDRYAETTDSTLTIIDADTLSILDTVPGVEAIAPGPDRLYLANDTRLWSLHPDTLDELETYDLDPRQFNEPLLLNSQANRLYLGRGRPWSLEVFEADTLAPVNSYALLSQLTHAIVDRGGERLFILENDGSQIVLRALDADGDPLAKPAPIPLTDNTYSDMPLASDGQTIYIAGGDYNDYRLDVYSLPNLRLVYSLPLSNKPYDLDIDLETGLLYAPYSGGSSYVLIIDPLNGPDEVIYTARTVRSTLADPAKSRLYALDDGGRLHVLDLDDYSQVARLETGFNILEGSRTSYGQLSLDPSRNRLYISGDPVRVVDTDTLEVVAHLDGRGQITPDPTGERLYLTPPCECRLKQCNTLILSAETLTGTQTLFPPGDPMTTPCVVTTQLDSENQLLYAMIYNGVPGSNSGDYYTIFDVSDQPIELYTAFEISYGDVALDPLNARAFAPRYRINRSFIHRFETKDQVITQTLTLVGAHGQLAYDPEHDRLYAVQKDALPVFDGELALLAEISLPGEFDLLAFDTEGQRLYLGGPDGNLLVVATGGGELEPPSPAVSTSDRPSIQQVLAAPDGVLFRIYDLRLYRSDDGGKSWQLLGTGLPGRPVGDLAISPDFEETGALLAGLWDFGFGGGVYRSTDGGDTWWPTTRGLTDLEVHQIAFSPTFARDRTVFLTTIDHGLFRSYDGGDVWTSLARGYATDEYDMDVSHLAVSPAFADDELVIISKHHLLRSTDGGESWDDTGAPGGLVAFSPDFTDDGLILNSGQWRSTDGGGAWRPAAVGREAGVAEAIFFSPDFAADQTVYLLLQPEYGTSLRLQRSLDAGLSWESLLGGLPPDYEIGWATLLPSGELYLTAVDGSSMSVAAEELEWGRLSIDITQVELQALVIDAEGVIYVANSSAGVFKSLDGGRSWVETDFPARADGSQHPAQLAVGDDGTLFAAVGMALARSSDGGHSWTYLEGLPPGFEIASLAVSPNFAEDGVLMVGGNYHNNQILRSADGGQSWESVLDGDTLNVEYASDVSVLAFSPGFARDETLFAWLQEGGLLRSTDSGLSWELVWESEYYAQSLAPSPTGNRLYLGALGGHTLASEDGGDNWFELSQNIPDDHTWSTAMAFGEDGAIFLASDKGVYRSQDGGETWSRASAGLPTRPADGTPQAVRALCLHDGRLYAALVEGGLFVSNDLGETWHGTIVDQPAFPVETPPTPTPEAQVPNETAPPTPTPQQSVRSADCPTPPDYFADLWTERVGQVGCPVASHKLPMAEQSFEGGWMFWRSDTTAIYALPLTQPYARFDDTWDESQPDYSCPDLALSQTPPTPQRGFGLVWCNDPLVRKGLGNATGEERLFEATLQEFDGGLIFETDQGVRYILESEANSWEQVD
jgi:photosystem II stability/assembly factor-like uncharacterized protein